MNKDYTSLVVQVAKATIHRSCTKEVGLKSTSLSHAAYWSWDKLHRIILPGSRRNLNSSNLSPNSLALQNYSHNRSNSKPQKVGRDVIVNDGERGRMTFVTDGTPILPMSLISYKSGATF